MAWQDELLPGSWRGVPFGMRSATITLGRQATEHLYPYRETDPAWVEDAGAGCRWRPNMIGPVPDSACNLPAAPALPNHLETGDAV